MAYCFNNIKNFRSRMAAQAIPIPVRNIMLTDSVHKKSIDTEKLGTKENLVVIVRRNSRDTYDTYSLITGRRDYEISKRDGVATINAIVVNISRPAFMSNFKKLIDVDKVYVPRDFINHPPKKEKVDRAICFYKYYGIFDSPITIKLDAKGNKILKDGYARYIAAKKLGVTQIPYKIIGRGVHNATNR
jgi:hypothetical protein